MTETQAEAATGLRRDTLPLWVITLLILFAVLRLYDVGLAPALGSLSTHHHATPRASAVDSDTVQDLTTVDTQAKTAFATRFGAPGAATAPDPKSLREALRVAEKLQRESGNIPSAARRVLILRALLDQPPLAIGKDNLDPLVAFGAALPPDTAPPDRSRYIAEGALWKTVYGGGRISPAQAALLAAQIRRIPNIRWWQNPALMSLYQRAEDPDAANRYARQAQARAALTLAPTLILFLLGALLFLLGLALLLYLAARGKSGPGADGRPAFDLWPTLPAPISPAERRLGAGDLMTAFVLFLLTPELLGLVLGGYHGIGATHLLRFHGILSPYIRHWKALPAMQLNTIMIVAEAIGYLLAALPPVVYLWVVARRRGASLGDELGWNTPRFGSNLLYGVGGYAIALPLLLLMTVLGHVIFSHAPAPSNPAIPEMLSASQWWVTGILVLLATVAAPLVEEFLFRGVFYNAVKLRLGVWPGIVLTGLVFGFVHPVGIAEMLPLATLGGVFAWMAETRKSLVPSMVAHCIQNTATTLGILTLVSG